LQLTSEKQDLEKVELSFFFINELSHSLKFHLLQGISNEKERTRELSSTINSLESELKSKIEELKVQQEGNKFIESTLSQVRTEKEVDTFLISSPNKSTTEKRVCSSFIHLSNTRNG